MTAAGRLIGVLLDVGGALFTSRLMGWPTALRPVEALRG